MHKLRDIQNKLLNMMMFFHNYCEQNGLRYYAVGGTALGAIRHDGFIPWDDDIDVGMPRPDYEKFIELTQNTIIENYTVETVLTSDGSFYYPFAKLYDTTTTLIENTKNQLKRGLYIDIFPLDGTGNSLEEAKCIFYPIDYRKKILGLRIIKVSQKRAGYKNIILKLIQAIPAFILSEKIICMQINELCKRKDYDSSQYVGNLVGAWGWKEIMPRELFGRPILHKFESIMVYCPEDYDGYLSHLYGDWRKLPPVEKQVSHHDYYLDLNRSYLDD